MDSPPSPRLEFFTICLNFCPNVFGSVEPRYISIDQEPGRWKGIWTPGGLGKDTVACVLSSLCLRLHCRGVQLSEYGFESALTFIMDNSCPEAFLCGPEKMENTGPSLLAPGWRPRSPAGTSYQGSITSCSSFHEKETPTMWAPLSWRDALFSCLFLSTGKHNSGVWQHLYFNSWSLACKFLQPLTQMGCIQNEESVAG
jgi:hypothetical protein